MMQINGKHAYLFRLCLPAAYSYIHSAIRTPFKILKSMLRQRLPSAWPFIFHTRKRTLIHEHCLHMDISHFKFRYITNYRQNENEDAALRIRFI